MAKYMCTIGFGVEVEKEPGIMMPDISERRYACDVLRNSRRFENRNEINDNLNVNNQFSIVADAYAYQNFFAMRYIVWMGAKWKISTVEVLRPRLLLTIGGVYNGPEPEEKPEGVPEET